MNPSLVSLIAFLIMAVSAPAALVAWMMLVRARRAPDSKNAEGGAPDRPGRWPHVPFFLVASLFLIFETGAVLLVPWALALGWAAGEGAGVVAAAHVVSFILLLGVAMAFALGSGAFDWER